jgi:hypothetical protein
MSADSGGFEFDADTAENVVTDIQVFNATLGRLRERRLTEIAISGPFLKSKLAWKIATYQQPVLYRVVMLASGCAANWNGRNLLCAYLAARALFETVAVFWAFEVDLQKLIEKEDLDGIDALITNRTFATRDAELVQSYPATKAIDILTFIDKLEKEGGLSRARQHYDSLSERCHPNSFGQHHFFSVRDRTTNVEHYSDLTDLEKHFDFIFADAMLIEFVERHMNRLDAAIIRVAELQHNIAPVPRT